MEQRQGGRSRALLLCAAVVAGCGQAEEAPQRREPVSSASAGAAAEGEVVRPALALSYRPAGESGTEGQIAQGQVALSEHPDEPTAYTNLAALFLRRARETSRPVYRTYARDVLVAGRNRFAQDVELRTLSSMLLLDEHRFEAAAAEARILASLKPSDPTPRLILGDALAELGQYDPAIDAYQEAMDLRPDLRSYNRAAYMRWLMGDFEGAREIMELAIDSGSFRDPESIAWCFSDLSEMFLHRGALESAGAAADRAATLVDGYAPALVVRARILGRQGKYDAAIEALDTVLAARPGATEYLLRAELQERAGLRGAAAESVAAAEKLAGHDPRPLAHYLARRGSQPQRALELAQRELDQRQNLWAWDTVALARLRTGDSSGAATAIAQALRMGTRDASMVLHRAMIERAQGKPSQARESLSEALAIDPGVDPELVEELRTEAGGCVRRAFVLAFAVAGCAPAPTETEEAPVPRWSVPEAEAATAQFDGRDQYELVDEIVAARHKGADDRIEALDGVRSSWEGRRYRWEVALSAPLCRADGCVALPFDHARRDDNVIVQGWLPQLELDEAQRGELLAACALYRACVFTVEATLRELTLTVDEPTSVSMTDVEFSGYREARPGESWVRRRPDRRAAADPKGTPRRTLGDERSERG